MTLKFKINDHSKDFETQLIESAIVVLVVEVEVLNTIVEVLKSEQHSLRFYPVTLKFRVNGPFQGQRPFQLFRNPDLESAIVVLVYNSGSPRVTTAFLTILPCDPEVQGQRPFKIFRHLAH